MTLKPLDQFPFEFYNTLFSSILAEDMQVYVPLHDMCTALGLQTNGQLRRIRESLVMAEALVPIQVLRAVEDEGGATREMLCLKLTVVPFWLGTLQSARIKDPEQQEAVVRFQREFADVAWAAFRTEMLPPDVLAELESRLPAARQNYLRKMDEATALRKDISAQGEQLQGLEARVSDLEARLVGTDFINPAQMKEYMDMVGILAHVLKKKRKGNEATVHAEVKRQFQIPSYQLIPEATFDDVKRYLGHWYQRLVGPGMALPKIFERPSQKRLL